MTDYEHGKLYVWDATSQTFDPASDDYRTAIDDALITRHLGVAKGDPRNELNLIVSWDVGVALDFERKGKTK
jgi:hypothetical protein